MLIRGRSKVVGVANGDRHVTNSLNLIIIIIEVRPPQIASKKTVGDANVAMS